ncbi:MAG: class I SAM-dependent methyltransferase [Sediminibacterium sp. Gen4]|jgi:ubiquinone/menaquinone biosynthesis C-methylase UbiE|uniref:class I SAM-dependent methyltransferase n=1 Tax=unclassified Sediminibacterium TaxID=2635961 RepID=UPI0015C147D7|nr:MULTISPECIES: class I SAM-dependent methyltransferase [unclassified Sediminibacterium]MBW0160810.1 class I SAM-dependent methyltransferase [Sediminibacterium sp.]MBW0164234.1 class I SAM-dependent methyltransferase [Sediminibacterium sp.]NWK65474.1 class I SAM-dependent methyltransferase [Sediminibacterium sp. Gen4]
MIKKKKFIPALGYNWLTDFYDLAIKLTMPETKFRNKLIDELDPKNNENILEFGFGTGQNIVLAIQRNNLANFNGVDIDQKVKVIAEHKINKLGLKANLELYDGKVFPYENNSFDKVFSSLVFHQLDRETKLQCLKEIYRVLKPNGQLVIGDWGRARTILMRIAFYTVQILDGFETTNDNVNGLLPNFIKDAGFTDVEETSFLNTKIGTYSYYKANK